MAFFLIFRFLFLKFHFFFFKLPFCIGESFAFIQFCPLFPQFLAPTFDRAFPSHQFTSACPKDCFILKIVIGWWSAVNAIQPLLVGRPVMIGCNRDRPVTIFSCVRRDLHERFEFGAEAWAKFTRHFLCGIARGTSGIWRLGIFRMVEIGIDIDRITNGRIVTNSRWTFIGLGEGENGKENQHRFLNLTIINS
jgi:hypothetical protein